MSARRIYGVGETTVDLIINTFSPREFKPGGAVLNACISLGRLGANVSLISATGDDKLGKLTLDFLSKNNVDTSHLIKFRGNTRLALAFLDEKKNAEYYFYQDRGHSFPTIVPSFSSGDILLHGSSFSLKEGNTDFINNLIQACHENGVIIFYDPNYRPVYNEKIKRLYPVFLNNFKNANIIKGSDQDFEGIFGVTGVDKVFEKIDIPREKVLIYTMGERGIWLRTRDLKIFTEIKKVEPVSTIGAGDTFNAGILYGLLEYNIQKDTLLKQKEETWKEILLRAAAFAAEVCLSMENYIADRR